MHNCQSTAQDSLTERVAPPAVRGPANPQHNPAANAVTHGLTAKKFIPDLLAERREGYAHGLADELQPASTLEAVLVVEIARHAAGMEFATHAEEAAIRNGARQHEELGSVLQTGVALDTDAALATALVTPAALQAFRQRRAHQRGFHLTLDRLHTLQAARREVRPQQLYDMFSAESACVDYLAGRLRADTWRCPRCGCGEGYWLPERQRRQCRHCHAQIGFRTATVMEHSPLPLTTWFRGIIELVQDPSIALDELQARLGLRRRATLQGVLARISAAMASPDADRLLAGLPRIVHRGGLPELGGAISGILRNGSDN